MDAPRRFLGTRQIEAVAELADGLPVSLTMMRVRALARVLFFRQPPGEALMNVVEFPFGAAGRLSDPWRRCAPFTVGLPANDLEQLHWRPGV